MGCFFWVWFLPSPFSAAVAERSLGRLARHEQTNTTYQAPLVVDSISHGFGARGFVAHRLARSVRVTFCARTVHHRHRCDLVASSWFYHPRFPS